MWQRNHTQDQQADSAVSNTTRSNSSALQAVQVALDRRDNGGDTHAVGNE
jgi:hypothetical protein